MTKKKILLLIVTILIMTSTLTACWDAIEIDERAYVMALGVDKYEAPLGEPTGREGADRDEEGNQISANIPQDTPRNRFNFTYAIPNVEFLVGESETANILYKTVGENLYSASRVLTTRLNKQIFFGHLKVLVVGESVARDSKLFREILDVVEREQFISRRIGIVIAPDNAANVLEVEPEINPMTGQFMADLFRNKDRSPRSGGGMMGEVLEDLHRWGDTVIPRVIPGETAVKIAGSAVIKNYQLQGWLGEIETRALEIMRGTARPGGLSVKYDGTIDAGEKGRDHEHIVPVDLTYLSRKFHLDRASDNIKITIEIETEGEIEQFYLDPEHDLLEPDTIRAIEDLLCEKIEEELSATIEKLQKEFEVDVIGINHYLSRFHPRLWEEVKEEWGEIFPTIDIVVDVDSKIRRIGLTR
ncbi:spore germination B3 GerAC family protein [Clostridium aceticum]|uniref:Spore germination B3 GerAC family protein n=1 Tax=Clostridium aceticum TaxID=84022 RepID=A0A0D8I5S9_9CLOT|nr:Ger(x)C family spore germination protein [Clostridium aceticum]AKL97131.1 spore germination B3 GerAC family protein [Clostridium aceticum]KJF25399.1 hypothetical protein TZ02_18890 [Clostridium aceticum]